MSHFQNGMIILWSGAIVDIPSGFALCDGNNGTPDLTDRFVVGAGLTFNPDDIGGSVNHTHTFTGDGHSHNIPAGLNLAAGPARDNTTTTNPATGTTDNGSTLPPFYALAYIMFL